MKSGAVLEPGVVLSLKVCACVFINGTCINYDMSHFFITFLFFCSNEMLILSCLVDIYILENCESNGAHHEKNLANILNDEVSNLVQFTKV